MNTYLYEMDDALGLGDGTIAFIEIEYSINGRYSPATYWEPEEWPDIDIESRKVADVEDCEGNELRLSYEDESRVLGRFDGLHDNDKLRDRLWEHHSDNWEPDYGEA